jgi:hypothetical protein
MLAKAGIHSTVDYRDRALFIGKFEAIMAEHQLTKNNEPLPFLRNENRGIMYTYYLDEGSIKFRASYFQVKEDYNLRLFNEKCFSLHIISSSEIVIFDREELGSIADILKQHIFKDLLKHDYPVTGWAERKVTKLYNTALDKIASAFTVRIPF